MNRATANRLPLWIGPAFTWILFTTPLPSDSNHTASYVGFACESFAGLFSTMFSEPFSNRTPELTAAFSCRLFSEDFCGRFGEEPFSDLFSEPFLEPLEPFLELPSEPSACVPSGLFSTSKPVSWLFSESPPQPCSRLFSESLSEPSSNLSLWSLHNRSLLIATSTVPKPSLNTQSVLSIVTTFLSNSVHEVFEETDCTAFVEQLFVYVEFTGMLELVAQVIVCILLIVSTSLNVIIVLNAQVVFEVTDVLNVLVAFDSANALNIQSSFEANEVLNVSVCFDVAHVVPNAVASSDGTNIPRDVLVSRIDILFAAAVWPVPIPVRSLGCDKFVAGSDRLRTPRSKLPNLCVSVSGFASTPTRMLSLSKSTVSEQWWINVALKTSVPGSSWPPMSGHGCRSKTSLGAATSVWIVTENVRRLRPRPSSSDDASSVASSPSDDDDDAPSGSTSPVAMTQWHPHPLGGRSSWAKRRSVARMSSATSLGPSPVTDGGETWWQESRRPTAPSCCAARRRCGHPWPAAGRISPTPTRLITALQISSLKQTLEGCNVVYI